MKNVFDDPVFKAVREAALQLEERHFVWMVDAAIAHFAASRTRCQDAIVRLERFPDAERFNKYGEDRERTPAEQIAQQLESLAAYEAILRFLGALHRAISTMSARKFATEFWAQRRKAG